MRAHKRRTAAAWARPSLASRPTPGCCPPRPSAPVRRRPSPAHETGIGMRRVLGLGRQVAVRVLAKTRAAHRRRPSRARRRPPPRFSSAPLGPPRRACGASVGSPFASAGLRRSRQGPRAPSLLYLRTPRSLPSIAPYINSCGPAFPPAPPLLPLPAPAAQDHGPHVPGRFSCPCLDMSLFFSCLDLMSPVAPTPLHRLPFSCLSLSLPPFFSFRTRRSRLHPEPQLPPYPNL